MRDDLLKARGAIEAGASCAVCRGDLIVTETGAGIAPLLSVIEKYPDLSGFSAADKVIGSAAAFLLIEAGVSEVFAFTVSRRAVNLLRRAGIPVSFVKMTDSIKNRKGDGLCPMEKRALEMSFADGAYRIFKERLEELRNEDHS